MIQFQLALDDEGPDVPAYSVRVSARARSVSLRVLPETGLEVTVPKRFDHAQIPGIVRENREWIEKAQQEAREREAFESRQWPPAALELAAIDQSVEVEFRPLDNASDTWKAVLEGDRLIISSPGGLCQPRSAVAKLVSTLLKRKARQFLQPMVALHAQEQGMRYRKLSIRGQRTLWGSYSSSGTLSLNYKLLFLPPDLVDYVILHELAHTRHMDHSSDFWDLLEIMSPGAKSLDSQLNEAVKLVPFWLERAG